MAETQKKEREGAARLASPSDARALARADAARGLPAADSLLPGASERSLIAGLELERARLEAARAAAQAESERTLRRLKPAAPDLAGPLAEARLALSQIEGRAAPECAAAAEIAHRAKEDLHAFRTAHRLRRAAVYPDSTLLQAGLLFCAALFEALFSATLFAQESEQGLLGGAAIAIGLSGANVSLGFLAGFLGLRYLQPIRALPRVMGGFFFALTAAIAIFLNFFAAIWRQSASASETARVGDHGTFLAQMFALTEPQAIVLLMLGGSVWVFAALKGYSGFDDPYPDYGTMSRAQRDAHDALADLRADVRAALEESVESARSAVQARIAAARTALESMRAAYDEAAAEIGAQDGALRRLDDEAGALIQLYRRENAAARTAPAPAYFADAPLAPSVVEDALAGCGREMQGAEALAQETQAAGVRTLQDLGAAMEAISARLDGTAREAPRAAA